MEKLLILRHFQRMQYWLPAVSLILLFFVISGCDKDPNQETGCGGGTQLQSIVNPDIITTEYYLTYWSYPVYGTFQVTCTLMFTNCCPDQPVNTQIGINVPMLPDSALYIKAKLTWGQGESTAYTLMRTGAGANRVKWFGWVDLDLKPAFQNSAGSFNVVIEFLFTSQGTDKQNMQYYLDILKPTLLFSYFYYPYK